MIHEGSSEEIIGAAMAVPNTLKPGLDEKLYENALVIELPNRNHRIDRQTRFPVHDKGQLIGKLIPDLIVDESVIVDPKVFTAFRETHVAQRWGILPLAAYDLPFFSTSNRPNLIGNVSYAE